MVRKTLNLGHSWLLMINNLREQPSEETVFNLFLFHCCSAGVTASKAELEGILFHLIPELLWFCLGGSLGNNGPKLHDGPCVF